MRIFAKTQQGKHGSNDDRILINSTIIADGEYSCTIEKGVVAIADGVGGNNAGNIASQFVCNAIAMNPIIDQDNFKRVNNQMFELASEKPEWKSMATTCTGIYFDDSDSITVFHVGNTRLYSVQAMSYLNQLTQDDTTVNYLVKTGKLTEEDAENYGSRNLITSCFGGDSEDLLSVKIFKSKKKSMYILTTDGIHESLSIDDMEELISNSDDVSKIPFKLINAAVGSHSEDDCSAIVISLEED